MAVLYDCDEAVAVVTIDRQQRRNAVDRRTAAELLAAYRRFEQSAEARVLVVTGAGRDAFCSGADLQAMDNDTRSEAGPMGFTRLESQKPTIAAVEGWCVAGGLEIALFCDLRVAGRSAMFGCLERRFGVPLIDGGTQRLPRIVGLGRALDLVLTGRAITADEGERIGLVNRVVDDGTALASAIALAREIASYPWSCVLADRASLLGGVGRPLPEGIAEEARRGEAVVTEAAAGAARFRKGEGRGGA